MEVRKIIHVDMDAFFASIEQRDHPELRGKPVAVGGSSKRGVVASASYEARQFGVRSAMPSITAARLCPGLIFTKHRFAVYREVSQQIREIFLDYTDLVEPLSLDEAYLDVTNNKKEMVSAVAIAEEIRRRIFEKTQLTASAGVSFNKFLAKIASDINKPNGLKLIHPTQAESFLQSLPVQKFHGVGKVTTEKMQRMGIYTGGDLKKLSEIELVQHFGKVGRHYYRIARAIDDRAVNPNRVRKSIGAERTFSEDLSDPEKMLEKLLPIARQVFQYMKKTDNYGRTLNLKMKTTDFQIINRSRTFAGEFRDEKQFLEWVEALLREHWKQAGAVRLLGVSVSNLSKETAGYGIQLELDFDL
ncbi:MAG: DNA polymerase IV [Bacteroidota bacterium]